MRNIFTYLGMLAVVVFALPGWAQTAQSNATALNSSQSNSGAVALSQGGSVYVAPAPSEVRSRTVVENTGDYTVRTAPQVNAPSMSSGHPCAYAPVSASLSIIGGGVGAGGQRIDHGCMFMQAGLTQAGVIYYASQSVEACRAARQAGLIASSSQCGHETRRTVTAAPNPARATSSVAASASIPAGSVSCERNSAGALTKVSHRRGVDSAAAVAYCRQQG